MKRIANPAVARAFASFPAAPRARAIALRALIFDVAKKADAGVVAESLKWGEPAYRTPHGSTIRLGWKAPDEVAMYFICTTGLVDRFRELYPKSFRFGGNRALLFGVKAKVPEKALRHCIAMALTYHRR